MIKPAPIVHQSDEWSSFAIECLVQDAKENLHVAIDNVRLIEIHPDWNPFHMSCFRGDVFGCVAFIILRGDPNLQTSDGETGLDIAERHAGKRVRDVLENALVLNVSNHASPQDGEFVEQDTSNTEQEDSVEQVGNQMRFEPDSYSFDKFVDEDTSNTEQEDRVEQVDDQIRFEPGDTVRISNLTSVMHQQYNGGEARILHFVKKKDRYAQP